MASIGNMSLGSVGLRRTDLANLDTSGEGDRDNRDLASTLADNRFPTFRHTEMADRSSKTWWTGRRLNLVARIASWHCLIFPAEMTCQTSSSPSP